MSIFSWSACFLALAAAASFAAPVLAQDTTTTLKPPPVPVEAAPEAAPDAATEPAAGTPPALPQPEVAPPPLPEPVPEVAKYFIDEAGTPGGPYTASQLQERIAAGTFGPETLTWIDGMAAWERADAIAEVASLLAADPAAPAAAIAPGADLPTRLAGTWTQSTLVPIEGLGMGQGALSVTLTAQGGFQMDGTITVQVNGVPAEIIVGGEGQYTTTNAQGDEFDLTMNGNVTMAIPSMGVPATPEPVNDTTHYVFVDANTIRDTATGDILTRVAS